MSVSIEIKRDHRPGWFEKLLDDKNDIETDLGLALEWHERPDLKDSYITITKHAPESFPCPLSY